MKQVLVKSRKYDLKYNYYVDELGRIYSEATHKYLSAQLDKDGYEKVQMISTDGKRHRYSVHRIVMENLNPVEDMEKLQVNHIDGNKQNNKLENLEWCTCQENILHAYAHNLHSQKGERNNQSKLTEENVKEIIQILLSKKYTQKEIGRKFNVCEDTIGAIKNKYTWKYLTEDIDFN